MLPPLVIDIVVRTDKLPVGMTLTRRGRPVSRTPSLLIERWRLGLDTSRAANVRLPLVYKRAIVHFRTLYAIARALPAAGLVRRILDARDAGSPLGALDVSFDIATTDSPSPQLQSWEMARIDTPHGYVIADSALLGSIAYADADLAVAAAPQSLSLDADLALLVNSPRSLGRHPLSSSPAPPTLPLHPTRSPLLQLMLAPDSCGSGGLRSLYDGYTTHTLRAGRSILGTSLPKSPSSATTRAQMIPRYTRQPSYRREGQGDDENISPGRGPVRSWSQRIEARRQMEMQMTRDTPSATAPGTSAPPGSTRLFRRAPAVPALALARPEREAHVADELTALVDMIDMNHKGGSVHNGPAAGIGRHMTNQPLIHGMSNRRADRRTWDDEAAGHLEMTTELTR